MKLSVGDRLAISSPNDLKKMRENYGKTDAEAVLPDDYTVTGIFDVGYYDFDANIIVTSLENAQDLYNLDDSVHGLMVMLRDPYQAAACASELQRAGPNYTSPPGWRKIRRFSARCWWRKTLCFTCCFSSCSSPRFAS